ncbi:MAG: hypothetical protein ABJH82_05070 [Polaribacter sp.]|uniref:hypothetical protein n=1 Tax=Polaribacter sp. TaxID=1920175 RepID=UPI003266FC23
MQDNLQNNFTLKNLTSILIGGLILAFSYFLKTTLDAILLDDSVNNVIFGFIITLIVLSTLILFVDGKKTANKNKTTLWNTKTKLATKKYLICFAFILSILALLLNLEYLAYLTPTFLILYGVLLFLFKNNKRKNLLVLSGLCLLLATMCFLIPSYWYSSISIIGIAHIAYGVVTR